MGNKKINLGRAQEALIRTVGNVTKAANLLGVERTTIQRIFLRNLNVTATEWYGTYLEQKQNKLLADTDILIHELQNRGYFVEKEAKSMDYKFTPNIKPFEGDVYKIGLVSDTHLGSKYQQLSHLYTFYEILNQRGITDVIHAGDVSDGSGYVYQGHMYELFLHGADEHIDYIIDNYPKYGGIKTYFICGNHDESFYKRNAIDIGKHISLRRPDLIHLGFHGAFLGLAGIDNLMYIFHGSGGVSYARSYRQQKMIEQLSPAQKPYFLFIGHYHITNTLWQYRNVFSQMLPCFQSQTPFLKRKGLNPEIGGMILEFRIVCDKPTIPKMEFIPFYVPIEKDY